MKRNLIRILTIAIMLTFLFSQTAFAKNEDDIYVRVRIRYPRLFNEQVSFEGYDEIILYYDEDELFSLNNNLTLRIDTYYTGNYYLSDKSQGSNGPYHAVLQDEVYASYEEAYMKAEELKEEFNSEFYPYLIEEGFIICGGNFTDKSSSQELAEELNDEGCNAESMNGNLENIIAYNNKNKPVFMYEKDMPVYFSSYNDDEEYEMIKVDNRAYRGRIALKIIDEFKLLTINYVELENYLYGVVPNEIPSSWGREALKAQALAARTYAVYNIAPRQLYDMEDNQNSQVYMGYDYEKSSTNRAVDETNGEMIYYDGELIQAFYHSTSGGSTENSENVWYEKLPYLRGVKDEFSDNSGSPHTTWQTTYYKEDIIRNLNLDDNDVDDLYGIQIEKVSENNRVVECIFLTDAGEISYKKENARLLLGLKSSWFSIINGNSFYFIIEYFPIIENQENEMTPSRGGILDLIAEEETEETRNEIELETGSMTGKYSITSNGIKKINREKLSFISSNGVATVDTNSEQYNFEGRGWGHGIGMSQYGAKQMAEEGYTYDEILQHYYTGVTIK
ncbi:MAG: SpoIID/LytB domain-containing protein [Tissierellia bacterium]|nr:SpoIID/LytB domain-containing protein [Tissierellia bacterium]MDD4436598.1 SpoIID/LytB domain-containing protein [Tissierellia bacterium]